MLFLLYYFSVCMVMTILILLRDEVCWIYYSNWMLLSIKSVLITINKNKFHSVEYIISTLTWLKIHLYYHPGIYHMYYCLSLVHSLIVLVPSIRAAINFLVASQHSLGLDFCLPLSWLLWRTHAFFHHWQLLVEIMVRVSFCFVKCQSEHLHLLEYLALILF